MNRARLAVPLLALLLGGCGSEDFSDLQAYMDEVRARPAGRIEPLPAFAPYQAFTYSAGGLRSPFLAPQRLQAVAADSRGAPVQPDLQRPRQALEQFDIDSLQMVGLLADARRRLALVASAQGIHAVAVGDYLGRNHGRIVAIHADRLEVREIVPDGNHGWLERPRTLPLKDGARGADEA